jgi:hypothetical protein
LDSNDTSQGFASTDKDRYYKSKSIELGRIKYINLGAKYMILPQR